MGNKKELIILLPLIIFFFLPLIRGENYNIENISITFVSLIYHVKSLLNGEIPFWISKLGMGTTFPLASDLSRYIPSYLLYFRPYEVFFSTYVAIHIIISWFCFYKILSIFGIKNTNHIHTLIFTFYFSNFFISTLYVNWLVTYYFAAIWMPIIFWSTINIKNKNFSMHACALWALIILSCFYSTYIRIFILISIFQLICIFIIFNKIPNKKELIVFFTFVIIVIIGSLDKAYLFIEEAKIGGIPTSNAFATYKSPLSVINQFIKPLFIPSNYDLTKYTQEFGSDGYIKYILANISYTPTPTKYINIGLAITIFSIVGALSFFKDDKRKFYLITFALLVFSYIALAPKYFFYKQLTGNWLAEPFFLFFIILSACSGIKYWNTNFKKKYKYILSSLITLQILTLSYTFIPVVYHLVTDKEILWFKYRTIVTDHTIPPYGLGYDYRNYGNDLFQEQLREVANQKDRLLMTRNTKEVVRAESSYKRLQFSAFNQDEKKQLFDQRWKFVENQDDTYRCNFFRGATVNDENLNVFNHYPKGKNLSEYIQDVQWPGVYLFRPENFFVNNNELLDLMGITILITTEEEVQEYSNNYSLNKIITCPFDNKKVAVMESKNGLGMAYLSNGKFPENIEYYKNCPYKIKLCYDVSKYRLYIDDILSNKIIFSSGVNYLNAVLPDNYPAGYFLHFANYFRPGWKAYDQSGKELEIKKDFLGFTAVKLKKDIKSVKIIYEPMIKIVMFYLYILVIFLLLFISIYKKRFDRY